MHLERDHPRPVVAGLVRRGDWVHLRRGALVETAGLSPDPHARRRQLLVARLDAFRRQVVGDHAASHTSAAVLWGLPLLVVPDEVHVVQATRRAGDSAGDVVRHYRASFAAEVTTLAGRSATAIERTVVDCVTTMAGPAGLVVADAAAAMGLLPRCAELLAEARGGRGVVVARSVLGFADGGAESPGETLARWALVQAGLPVPSTQVEVETDRGVFWADVGWPEWRVVVEYDGRTKYLEGATDAVLREKRRQDAITDAGWRLVRAMSDDVRHPERLVRRVVRALPPGVVGRLRPRRLLAGPPSWA